MLAAPTPDADGPIVEVSFDTCIGVLERGPGSCPGHAPHPGDRWRCLTHDLTLIVGQPTYFQAIRMCALVAMGSPSLRPRRATRSTTHLTADDAVKLYLALTRANLLGMTLTYFATISWSTLGLDDDAKVQAAAQALFARLREWSKRKRNTATGHAMPIPLAWIWCHERGPRLGLHTHLLMHVPRRSAPRLGKVICKFLADHSGRSLVQEGPDGVITFKALEPPLARGGVPQDRALAFQRRLTRYMLKGVDPQGVVPKSVARNQGQDLASALKLPKVEDQGQIMGKRCGYSVHNLGKTAFASAAPRHGMAPDEAETVLAASGFAFDTEALVMHQVSYLTQR